MKFENLTELIWRSLILLFLQIFVLNYYAWSHSYTPFPYIMILLLLPLPLPWYAGLLVGFFLGVIEDIFTTKQGLHSASLTLLAFVKPVVLQTFSRLDDFDDGNIIDSRSLGWRKWIGYVLFMTLIYCSVLYFLQYFSFYFKVVILKDILLCTAVTFLFILAFEMLFQILKKKPK